MVKRVEPRDDIKEALCDLKNFVFTAKQELSSGFKQELRKTHQIKVEELIPRSAQVLRLSSNTAEVGRL